MKKTFPLFEEGDHRWLVIARDPEKPNYLIDTNEYLISSAGEAILCDPGGQEIFPEVFTALSSSFDPQRLVALFSSHQDPDIISSLALWLEFKPDLKCYLSRLWSGFIPHFGGNNNTFIQLADSGGDVIVGNIKLKAIPAHYLHSSGNFNLYDPKAKILFSGDIGAALTPDNSNIHVTNFDSHIRFAEGFHRRWMGSNEAKRIWCERVSTLEIDMLCPQHGAIYSGADVQRFINWFDELRVGILS